MSGYIYIWKWRCYMTLWPQNKCLFFEWCLFCKVFFFHVQTNCKHLLEMMLMNQDYVTISQLFKLMPFWCLLFLVPQLFFIYLFFNWKFSHAAFRGRQSGPSASISVTPTMCMSSFTASIQWKFEHELENKITFIKHYLTWCFHKHPECGRTWMDGKPQHWYNRLPDRNYDALAWKHFIQLCPYILFWGKILAELFNV